MKKESGILSIFAVCGMLVMAGCSGSGSKGGSGGSNAGATASSETTATASTMASPSASASSSSTATAVIVSEIITTPNGTTVKIITTPTVAEVTAGVTPQFPTTTLDTPFVSVPTPFIIAETDTTYALWKEVYDWATNSARGTAVYSFANAGQNGTDGSNSNAGFSTATSMQYPVTKVNWRDAIIWCNAFTEYYNANNGTGTDLEVVYCFDSAYKTSIRTSTNSTDLDMTPGSQDSPYVNASAKGFRLPASVEYEFAARYIGTTLPSNTNYILRDGVYYTNGVSASGAMGTYSDATATGLVGVYGVSSTSVVKSKTANTLGLYDMSGNVWKWNFSWSTSWPNRERRGGAFDGIADDMQVSDASGSAPYRASGIFGFRLSRTK